MSLIGADLNMIADILKKRIWETLFLLRRNFIKIVRIIQLIVLQQ